MNEEWRDIIGFEGYYQASNLGRVRSLDRTRTHRSGVRKSIGRIRIPTRSGSGGRKYLQVTLTANGRIVRDYVHRFVIRAFVGEIPVGHDIHHINGITSDNRFVNLAIVPKSHHYQQHSRGSTNGNATLTEQDVLEIRKVLAAGTNTQAELADLYGVCSQSISMINRGRTWKHLLSEQSS